MEEIGKKLNGNKNSKVSDTLVVRKESLLFSVCVLIPAPERPPCRYKRICKLQPFFVLQHCPSSSSPSLFARLRKRPCLPPVDCDRCPRDRRSYRRNEGAVPRRLNGRVLGNRSRQRPLRQSQLRRVSQVQDSTPSCSSALS